MVGFDALMIESTCRQNNEASLEGFPFLAATAEASSWKELVNGELADINVVEQYMLGGYRPETSNLDKGTGLPLGEVSPWTKRGKSSFGAFRLTC